MPNSVSGASPVAIGATAVNNARMKTTASVCLLSALSLGAGQTQPATPIKLPADAEHASAALMESPRHGEWVDVSLGGSEAKIKTWIVYPERKDPAPVVLVIHEIFGLTDWVRAVADQLAADGFIAVAPDLLSGKGPDGGGTESFAGDKVREAIRALSQDEVAQRLAAVREYALALPASRDKAASIGFCWGGSASFNYAADEPKLDAAVVYYGTGPTDREALATINCPVLGLYGGDDARVTSTVEATASAMKSLNKTFTSHVYDGAGHGFLRQRSGERAEANIKAATAAWAETIAFLRRHTAP